MEKEALTLDTALTTQKAALTTQKATQPFSQRLLYSRLVIRLAHAYTVALGRRTTPRQALHLTHVQTVAALLLLPQVPSLAYYVLTAAWFLLALRGCRRSFAAQQR